MLPFGYGLSFTSFKLAHSGGAPARVGTAVGESFSRSYGVTVTNTGAMAGDEVVQAYMHPPAAAPTSGGLPLIKQLVGFERVSLGVPAAERSPRATAPAPCAVFALA